MDDFANTVQLIALVYPSISDTTASANDLPCNWSSIAYNRAITAAVMANATNVLVRFRASTTLFKELALPVNGTRLAVGPYPLP